MLKIFKKNQRIIATLPSGREVEGVYIEPYGERGHSFYINEFDGTDKNGCLKYKKVRYGVDDDFIEPFGKETTPPSESQYKAWLKRAIDLEARIEELEKSMNNGEEDERKTRKLNRVKEKLTVINEKIAEFEQ